MADTSNTLHNGVSLADAPGVDLQFDDLFPNLDAGPPEPTTVQPVETAPAQPEPPAQPAPAVTQPPVEEPWFLKSADGKIAYRTREDAIRGISHKDEIFDNLKANGIDVARVTRPTQQPTGPSGDINYAENPERYVDDLAAAAEKGNKREYARIQAKYQYDLFAPAIPVIVGTARANAVAEAERAAPGVSDFLRTDDYKSTLDAFPELKAGIEMAEQNMALQAKLPGLYKMARTLSMGLKAPGMLVSAAHTAPTPTTTAPTSRPSTMQPGQMTPPQPGAPPDLSTTEGRKALIERAKGSGVLDFKF